MDPTLAFRGLGYAVIGLLLLMMLVIGVVSIKKEERTGEPIRALLWLTIVILALCTGVALSSAYISTRLSQGELQIRAMPQ